MIYSLGGEDAGEIIFVDNYFENVTACADLGIIDVMPMEVVNFIEEY